MTTYNKAAVQREIDKDKRIKGREAKNIHRLLAGWRSNTKKSRPAQTCQEFEPDFEVMLGGPDDY
jgi:hypothetical protein